MHAVTDMLARRKQQHLQQGVAPALRVASLGVVHMNLASHVQPAQQCYEPSPQASTILPSNAQL